MQAMEEREEKDWVVIMGVGEGKKQDEGRLTCDLLDLLPNLERKNHSSWWKKMEKGNKGARL